jgi:hypothetical protein
MVVVFLEYDFLVIYKPNHFHSIVDVLFLSNAKKTQEFIIRNVIEIRL